MVEDQTKFQIFMKWLATATLIVGTFINALNIYPLGAIILVLGGVFWSIVSISWREPAMITTNLTLTAVGLIGLAITYYG